MGRFPESYAATAILLFLLLANVSCTFNKKPYPVSQQNDLLHVDLLLEHKFEQVLKDQASDLSIHVSLLVSKYIDTQQYRNTKNIINPGGVDATRHEFFLLADNPFPNDTGSTLNRYELIVGSAGCLSLNFIDHPGCKLLRRAKKTLQAPKKQPSPFRLGWPKWRPIGVVPENWAEDNINWSSLRVKNDVIDVQMNYLYIKPLRGWFSSEFLSLGAWFVKGTCKGFISDGNADNDRENGEFLPKLPVGILLAKNLVVIYNNNKMWEWQTPHIIGWVNKTMPLSPLYPDPCKQDCPTYNEFKHYCMEQADPLPFNDD